MSDERIAAVQAVLNHFPMWSGQMVGLIHDLPGAAEVVANVIREARAALDSLGHRVRR